MPGATGANPLSRGSRNLRSKVEHSVQRRVPKAVAYHNAERRAFCDLCWHIGGAQSDIANLNAEYIDGDDHTIGFFRKACKKRFITVSGLIPKPKG